MVLINHPYTQKHLVVRRQSLHIAAAFGLPIATEMLLNGPEKASIGTYAHIRGLPLGLAIKSLGSTGVYEEVVRILLRHGSPVMHEKDTDFHNPLMYSIRIRHVRIIRMLLDAGAKIRRRYITWAAQEPHAEHILRLLLERSEKFPRDFYNEPLKYTSRYEGNVGAITLFLNAGADAFERRSGVRYDGRCHRKYELPP
jgi:hypothetical protein